MEVVLVVALLISLVILIATVNAVLNIAKYTRTIRDILADWEEERNKQQK